LLLSSGTFSSGIIVRNEQEETDEEDGDGDGSNVKHWHVLIQHVIASGAFLFVGINSFTNDKCDET
jgi:hypothetical protein